MHELASPPETGTSLLHARGPNRLVGTWMPSTSVVLGLGLYRSHRIERDDPNRNRLLRNSASKTQRIAAVGVSLIF